MPRSTFVRMAFGALLAMLVSWGAVSTAATAASLFDYGACHKVEKGLGPFKDAKCSETGGGGEVEEYAFFTPTEKLKGSGGTATLKGKPGGISVELTCATNTFEAKTEEEGKSSEGQIALSSCTVKEPSHCAVSEPILVKFNGAIEEGSGEKAVDVLTGSATKERFAEVELKNNIETCTASGKALLTGAQTCEFESKIALDEKEHEVSCPTSGSGKLLWGGVAATLVSTEKHLKLTSELDWQVTPRFLVRTPSNRPPKLAFGATGEELSIVFEFRGAVNQRSGVITGWVGNRTAGAFVEGVGGTCPSSNLLSGQTCTMKVKLEGAPGAIGGAGLVTATDLTSPVVRLE